MKKIYSTSSAVGFIGAVLLTLVIAAQLGYGRTGPRQRSARGDFDRHFIEQMIPHHQDAVWMADLALKKAEHRQLKELAAEIKTEQTAEIKKMRSWYKSWYGTAVPERPRGMGTKQHGGPMHGNTDIRRLRNAKPFDKEFIRQMIPHHQMAVMMARAALGSDREQIRRLARNIIASQNREIDKMRRWNRQWYPASP